VFFLFQGGALNNNKKYKNKKDKGIRWLLFDILHATNNQKHGGGMGYDARPCKAIRGAGFHCAGLV
jgi:hypothetical protein